MYNTVNVFYVRSRGCLLGYDALWTCMLFIKFWMKTLPPSSELKTLPTYESIRRQNQEYQN